MIKLWVRKLTKLPDTSILSYQDIYRCTVAIRKMQPKGMGTDGFT